MIKSMLIIFIFILLSSCASYKNPRQIKEAKLDALRFESLNRYDEDRLKVSMTQSDPLSLCYRGDFDDALKIFKKDLDQKLNNYQYWNQISSCYINQKKYTQAKKFLNISLSLAKTSPQKSIILNNFGVIYMENENFEEAKEYFKKSIELDQSHLTPKFNLTQIFLKFGLYKNAGVNIDFLLNENSQDIDFLHSKAHLELMLQNHKSALVYFNKIPAAYRTRDDIATNMAMTYFMLGLYDSALQAIDKSDKKNEFYINAQVELKEKIHKLTKKIAGN